MRRFRGLEWIVDGAVYTTGFVISVVLIFLIYYVAREARYAFDQTYPWGYRLALLPDSAPPDSLPSQQPFSTLVTASLDGSEGVDEREESARAPSLNEMSEESALATVTPIVPDLDRVLADNLYRDDWRVAKSADRGDRFLVFGFASPEYRGRTFFLAWEPDHSFEPKLSPYRFTLRLVRAPQGVQVQPFSIDLKQQPSGRIELPTWVARTDADRTRGYVFEVLAEPHTSSFWTALRNIFHTEWEPTLIYPRYGMLPLLLGTTLMTLIALAIAVPLALAVAVYLSEIAQPRWREWLKPVLELLSSVPTVVLGYFGLMFVAPNLHKWFGSVLGIESGRNLFTAALLLAVLAVPIIASMMEDALKSVSESLRESSLAIGLTHIETVRRVILPAARGGIVAAVLIGAARVYGETMIVWILSGGTASMIQPSSISALLQGLLGPSRGIPDTIAIEMGNVGFESAHYGHLFLLGVILFAITLLINLTAVYFGRKQLWRQ